MLFLFLAQVCVGINIVLYKGLISHINPILIMTVRFIFASLFMSILLFRDINQHHFRTSLDYKGWGILLVKGLGAGIAFNFILLSGLHYTDANSAGLITSLLPAVIICLNILLFRQKLTSRMSLSLLVSVAGLVLINWGVASNSGRNIIWGNFLVFIALIPDGLYYTLSKYYPLKMHPMLKVFWLNAVNVPFLIVIVFFLPKSLWGAIILHDWLMFLIIGINSGLFFILWQKGITNIDAAYAALSTAFMPVATVILAWVILNEGLTITKFIGMILVVFSIVVYARK